MNALCKTTLLVILSIPMVSRAGKPEIEKSRILKRTYPLEAQGGLQISNRFGTIRVETWDQARAAITVTIKVSGTDAGYVSDRFENISVDFHANPTRVQAKTVIKKIGHRLRLFRNNSINMQINYSIQVPKTANLELKNTYGNIHITDTKGEAHIELHYGTLKADQLVDGDLKLNYNPSNHIEKARNLRINAAYSNFKIDTASAVDIKSNYSHYKIKHADSVNCDCDYGSLRLGEAKDVREKGDFHILRADTIYKQLTARGDYGKLSVKHISKNFTNIDLEAQYKITSLSISPEAHFSFDLKLDRTRFHSNLALHYRNKEEKRGAAKYTGWYDSQASGSEIRATARYGSLRLDKAKTTSF